MGTGTGLMVIGFLWLSISWWMHGRGPRGGDIGEWRTAPHAIRRLVRRGHGPILYWSLAAEAWGFSMVLAGVFMLAGLVPEASHTDVAATVLVAGSVVVGGGALALEMIGRFRERSKR